MILMIITVVLVHTYDNSERYISHCRHDSDLDQDTPLLASPAPVTPVPEAKGSLAKRTRIPEVENERDGASQPAHQPASRARPARGRPGASQPDGPDRTGRTGRARQDENRGRPGQPREEGRRAPARPDGPRLPGRSAGRRWVPDRSPREARKRVLLCSRARVLVI